MSRVDAPSRTGGRWVALLAAVFVAGLAGPSTPASADVTSTLSPAQVQAKEWWIERLNLHKTWKITRGAGVTVAVLDTGVEGGFADLRGAIVPGFDTAGPGNGETDTNSERHGTRIADEIAGRGTGFGLLGVAPKSQILPVKVAQTADATAVALNRLTAMAHPPQVVNMSYGPALACPADVQQAVTAAVAAGMILVAAAGNTAASGNQPNYPADCTGVVAAGAINYNGRVWFESQRQSYVALAGPGVHMIGYYPKAPGFGYGDGTSDAAAMVSATMALVRAKFPALSSRQVVARVLATAHQFVGKDGTRNRSDGYGGALPYEALTQHVPADAPNPIYAALGTGLTTSSPPATTSPAPAQSSSSQASGTQPSSSQPTPTTTHFPTGPASVSASSGSSSGSVGLIVGIAFAVLVVACAVFLFLIRSRGRRAPGGPTGGARP